MNKWISVKDKLPEPEVPVLVTYLGYNTGLPRNDGLAIIIGGEWFWHASPDDEIDDTVLCEITHWMPLPEPAEDTTEEPCPTESDDAELNHGKWHIMSEDPYDETNCPKDEGWYRIITSDGEEMTDYYFNIPTLTRRGCVYWKNCTKVIRAWAKIEEKENSDAE